MTCAPLSVSKSVESAIHLFFNLSGWKLTTEPSKTSDFAASFAALGIVFNVGRLILKDSTITNKAARIEKVSLQLKEAQSAGTLSAALSDSLRGKVQFMEMSIFGRAARCVAPLFDRTNRKCFDLTRRDSVLVDWLCQWLLTSPPRHISPKFSGQPLLLFSDGACEFCGPKRILTCGALLWDPRDSALLYFGFTINEALEAEWSASGRRQLVTEAELLPQLVARRLWASRLKCANLISFLDSEPAKFCCIKGSSDSPTCEDIVRAIQTEEQALTPWTWYSRVPTYSNPSDAASRLDFVLMERLFPSAIRVDAAAYQPASLIDGIWA